MASRVVMEWFTAQPFPVFAFGGRFQHLPVGCCGTNSGPAIESAVNAIAAHGHRRIVLLIQHRYIAPTPIITVKKFLAALEGCGISATAYHLPRFEDSADGFEERLNSLFQLTPPTALLVHEANHGAAVLSFLARWMGKVAKGRSDQRQVIFDAEYVPGGTVGPVKK